MSGTLYFGDNLHVLKKYIKDESVDLIYLDPPFNSNVDYNLLFCTQSGSGNRAQIQAFDDTWTWGEEAEQALDDIIAAGGRCSIVIQALREVLGANDLTAYLVMMTVRLIDLHRSLKKNRIPIFALRSDSESLLKNDTRCYFRPGWLSVGDYLEAHNRAQQRSEILAGA